jgi:putative component of membrane protein insertase Oxa1/YidC/SpoIIIJ protein YidD
MPYAVYHIERDRRHLCSGCFAPRPRFRRMLAVCLMMSCTVFFEACAPYSARRPDTSLYEDVLYVYREPLNHLSAVRRGVCPMYPSCSEYSRQAVERHGFILGWIMAMDRLLRCGRDELRRGPSVLVDGEWKFYDPLSANDDWWYSAGKDAKP